MNLDFKTVVKYAAIAFACWVAYDKIFRPMIEGQQALAAGKTPEQIAAEQALANAKTVEEARKAAEALAQAQAAQAATHSEVSTLAKRLMAAAGVQTLDVNGWNYYMRTLNPNAVVSDLFEVGVVSGQALTVGQYLAARDRAGIGDGSSVPSPVGDNYRDTSGKQGVQGYRSPYGGGYLQ